MTDPQKTGFNKAYLKKKLNVIKLIIILLCFGTEVCSGSLFTYSQITKLSLILNNKSVKEIFNEIEKNSEYIFFYSDDAVDVNRKISIQAENQTISEILDQVFKNTNNLYTIDDRQVYVLAKAPEIMPVAPGRAASVQQTKTVTGIVTDASGEPLIGVSITIKGTNIGIATDVNGAFSLSNVSSNNQLVVSYIGFITQEIPIDNKIFFNVRLIEESKILEEVVVVGYGVQKKETLSGAVTAIKSEEILTTKTENFISNIQGKIAGLQIRQQTGLPGIFDNLISIRGYGAPLVVIDGVRRGRNDTEAIAELAQLNSEDIESVSILKDASAAIYGMNSSNGVLLVTTKKGSTQGKARVSYTGRLSIEMPTGLEYTMDAYNYMLMANEMQRNDGRGMYAAYDFETLEKYRTNQPGYQDMDLIDLTLRDSTPSTAHDITIRGGNEQTQYFVSAGYTRQDGLLKSGIMYYDRYNFRTNLTTKLSNDLTMNVSISGQQANRNDSNEDFWAAMKAIMTSERGKNWHTIANPEHYTYYLPEGKNLKAIFDPDVNGYRRWETLRGRAQVELTYKVPFVSGLTLSSSLDYNVTNQNNTVLRKSYILYDYESDKAQSTWQSDEITNATNSFIRGYFRLMATYNKKIGSHGINAMGAMEGSKDRYNSLSGSRRYADLYTQPTLNMATASTATNSGTREDGRLAAYLGRVNYDYAGKYLLELVGRYDGSFKYAPEKRWVFFPSVSAAWRLSEEQFVKNLLPFLDNLKIRASYGETGRDQGDEFQYIPGYTSSADRGTIFGDDVLTTGTYPPGVVNNLMSWVTSEISNVGVDLDLQGGKFGASFEFFQRKNTGVLAPRVQAIPNFFGASLPDENIDSDMNIGIELDLRHQGKIGKDFTYKISANATFARQKTLHSERAQFTSQWNRWLNSNENRYLGRSLIYLYNGQYATLGELETAPLHGGALGNSKMLPGEFRIIDKNGDGIINTNDRVFENWAFGNEGFVSGRRRTGENPVNPPLQYGFTFMGAFKNFSLNLLLQGAALYSVNIASNDVWGYGRYPSLHEKYYDRWHTLNNDDDPYNPATAWVSGKFAPLRPWVNPRPGVTSDYVISLFRPLGTYLRLKNVELGYAVPRSVLSKFKISNLRLFMNATNLLTFMNEELKNFDPEKQEKDYQGNLTYPIMKAVSFGLTLNF